MKRVLRPLTTGVQVLALVLACMVARATTVPGVALTRAADSASAGQAPGSFPDQPDAVRFAVIGDNGNGAREQYDVGNQMASAHAKFPYDFVVMMGDNLYGGERPQDFVKKFEAPYKPLLDAGVKFYATLGNHDDPNQRFYKLFNMNGERYYTFSKGSVRFFVLDSNYMDAKQLAWLEQNLKDSGSDWKIAYFHHPLYSSGQTHGSEVDLRALVEPLFIKYGMNVVLAGHEHFYERIKPQKGIYYFISGAAGQLRPGDIRAGTGLTAYGYDRDRSFMLMQIAGDELNFQAISRTGQVIDTGVIRRQAAPPKPTSSGSQ